MKRRVDDDENDGVSYERMSSVEQFLFFFLVLIILLRR